MFISSYFIELVENKPLNLSLKISCIVVISFLNVRLPYSKYSFKYYMLRYYLFFVRYATKGRFQDAVQLS